MKLTKTFLALLLLFVAGVASAATEYEIDQKFSSVAALDGQLFCIVNETDSKAIFNKDAQNLDYQDYATAVAGTAYLWKIHSLATEADTEVQSCYTIEVVKADGSSIGLWGNPAIYLNSGAEGGFNGCFVLGNKDQYGTDVKYGGAWEIEYAEGQGFALKNKARGGYFAGVNPAPAGTEPIYWTFCTLKEKASTDPLATFKDALINTIAKGKMYFSLAFTDASFGTLIQAIDNAEAALAAADATEASLTAATTAINDAIAALALKDGFTELTAADFKAWDSATAPTEGSATGCSYELFVPSGLPYGDGNVGWKNFANLAEYSKLYVTYAEGTPRIMMNRDVDGGNWNAEEAKSHLIEFPKDGWSSKYFTNENNIVTVDLAQIVADKGIANLNAIKGANWQNVTVTGMYLYKAAEEPAPVVTPAYGTIWENGETSVEGEYTVIKLDPAYFKDFAKVGDTLRVNISNPDEARAPFRTLKKRDLKVFYTDGAETKTLFENSSLDKNLNLVECAITDEFATIVTITDPVIIRYKNLSVDKVELVQYVEPTPEPLFADGIYYIYNKGVEKFLAAGESWGTHAVVNETGLDYTIAFADGKYTLDSQVSNGGENHFLNGEWNDGVAFGWTIAKTEDGDYTISNGEKFLTANAEGLVVLADDATAEAAHWTLKTLSDRIGELATAKETAPVDATFLIADANFGRNDLRKSAWTMNASNQNLSGGNDVNNCAESYHSTFTLSQVLANAPAGKYQMTAQGFYRQDDGETEELPVFYANDKTAEFPAKSGEENSMSNASESFTKGQYTIDPIEVIVFEDGQLTIGAKGTATHQWVIFDNFRLTYLTSEIPADVYKPAYEEALAAAQAALANEDYAAVTGEEKTALENAIADYTTVEDNKEAYEAAIAALNAATNAFTAAKAAYEALLAAQEAMSGFDFNAYPYAAPAKKEAAAALLGVEASSADDAKAKTDAITKAFRQYAESSALLEGVEGAINKTEVIVNPNAEEAIAEPWAVILGEGSGGSLDVKSNEPLTDGDGNANYKYFDGGNWGANAWNVTLQQTINLPKGKYQLTVSGRAAAETALTLFANDVTNGIAAIGNTGGLFGRGWSDASVEFELAEDGDVLIGVQGVTDTVHNWMSFTRFRLMQFPDPTGIETVKSEKVNGQYFDLQGRRVQKPANGLYIVNGKKLFVK